jgi:CRISPR-associated protein Cas2
VMVLEKVPRSLRGELTRWMTEVQTGVFIGKVSGLVRDLLWEKCVKRSAGGRCCQAYTTNSEQGFSLRVAGDSRRSMVDLDGIVLLATRSACWESSAEDGDRVFDK